MNQNAKRYMADVLFHLGNAQRALNGALREVGGREHENVSKLADYNAKLMTATRQASR